MFYQELSLEEFPNLRIIREHMGRASPNRMEEDFIAGAIYLKKHQAFPNERLLWSTPNNTLSFEEIVQSTLLTKWSVQTTGEAAVQYQWAEANVCNADPDQWAG